MGQRPLRLQKLTLMHETPWRAARRGAAGPPQPGGGDARLAAIVTQVRVIAIAGPAPRNLATNSALDEIATVSRLACSTLRAISEMIVRAPADIAAQAVQGLEVGSKNRQKLRQSAQIEAGGAAEFHEWRRLVRPLDR